MKQAADLYTGDMLEAPKRGRPRKPDALTPAQRARRYRAKQREQRDVDQAANPALSGLTRADRLKLATRDVRTDDDLADLTVDELVSMTGLDPDAAREAITKARVAWFTPGWPTMGKRIP